jgi:very-short-patch-repair endonuclease
MIRVPKTLEKSCDRYKDIWSKRNEFKADQVFISSGTKVWFDCHNCGHEYNQRPGTKTRGIGCPFCSKFNSKLCGDIKCSFCLPKSCDKYKNTWSSKNDKKPQEVTLHSSVKFWFYCPDCSHSYEQKPSHKTSGSGCSFCTKFNTKLCGDKSCLFCLEKSCYKYKEIWSQKNSKKPQEVSLSSDTKYFFNCLDCSHDYYQSPASKTNSGSGCPFCSNRKICGDKSCLFCLPKSCNVYSDIWSSKNDKTPEQVSISNGTKYFFNCLDCIHRYEQTPRNKTKGGNGCPFCKNKTERKVADFLKEINIKFKKEFKIDSNKRYDFYLPDFNLIIEIDGNQHFKQISNWNRYEHTIENDIQKMKIAIENGYSILRIYQPDIWKEKIDWKKYIKDNFYLRKTPTICYQASVFGTYDDHLKIYSSVI